MLETVFFLLQVGFTGHFVLYCTFKLGFWQILTPFFSLTVLNFVVFFSGYWIANLMRIPKMGLKQPFPHPTWLPG